MRVSTSWFGKLAAAMTNPIKPSTSPTRVRFETFKSSFKSWSDLFQEAADFAETIRRERLIGISHSVQSSEGVVAVWYWSDDTSEL